MTEQSELPLSGVKVIEFSHMVMGPTAGVILADLGADVVKIEPIDGDNTRRLRGSGAGYFAMYNRNKRSICVDLKSESGSNLAKRLINGADVLVENFRPGAMDKLGYGYDKLSAANPGLIYCSARGFLNGPYQNRTALDEVVQMMAGLAYMTGLPDRPMRAGASVVDVMGGMFAVIGVLSALESRHQTGRGKQVVSSLFESTAFLMGQHMAQQVAQDEPVKPMSIRTSAWSVYDIFETQDDEKVFVAVVSDTQWRAFCKSFELDDLLADESLAANGDRVLARDRILPVIGDLFLSLTKSELMARLEECGLPFAGIGTPADLFDEPHLLACGGLIDVTMQDGKSTRLPALPLQMDGNRFGLRHDIPKHGQHTKEILKQAGMTDTEVEVLFKTGVVA
ncbi:MAG: CaiB/BaiF CoA-transferase family protein [Pseudomonadota bacterium]|nr:CaiB/BaiF CoA-transferase family protein [Pseudomonadota bacterium]